MTHSASIPVVHIPPHAQAREALPQPLKRLRILLLKPYQPIPAPVHAPPLGILFLASAIRQRFGGNVDVRVIDMKVLLMRSESIRSVLAEFRPDVIGLSALNYEAQAAHDIAAIAKAADPSVVTVMGGPYPFKHPAKVLQDANVDWVFDGPADRTFPEALARLAAGQALDGDLAGFSYRKPDGGLCVSGGQDQPKDLDSLPLPAWDLVDFDHYAAMPNPMANLKSKRYAQLFTSRGCPYLCSYCHDLFTKRFVYRSVDHVLSEIELLHEKYGVDEFQISDDIFNLHKPRVKEIMARVKARWPGKLKFTFPNGLRADILDKEVIDALADGGTYAVAVAIETVTPRLQTLVQKNLDIERTRASIEYLGQRGIQVTGFFMLGFPTETLEEMQATIDFALESQLTLAYFFTVIPQPGTPLFDLALQENPQVTRQMAELDSSTYRDTSSWYEAVYGHSLTKIIRKANLRFYLSPRRLLKICRHHSPKILWRSFLIFMRIVFPWPGKNVTAVFPQS